MDTPRIARGPTRVAAALVALIATAAVSSPARADYLIRTFPEGASAAVRSPLQGAALPQLAGAEPFTVDRPYDDSAAGLELDEATLAAVQALLVCAIPPPVNTIITTTSQVPQPPVVAPPPPYTPTAVPETSVPTGGGTSTSPPQAPEPATLLLALVGSGLTGVVMLRKRGRKVRGPLAA
jgi:hypothetical protein